MNSEATAIPIEPQNLLKTTPFPEKKRSGFHFSITVVCSVLFLVAAAGHLDRYPTFEGKLKCAIALLSLALVALCCIGLPTPDYPAPLKHAYKLILSLAFVYMLNVTFMALLDRETLHRYLVFLDPTLATPLPERVS